MHIVACHLGGGGDGMGITTTKMLIVLTGVSMQVCVMLC